MKVIEDCFCLCLAEWSCWLLVWLRICLFWVVCL